MSKIATQNQTSTSIVNPPHPAPTQNITGDNLQLEINRHLQPYQDLAIPNPLSADFTEPVRYGDYTKLEEGENTLRILSEGVIGCEYWTKVFDPETNSLNNKPVRRPVEEATTLDTLEWSYFYAFFVWNYKAQKIQIFSTSKRGVIKGLLQLSKNPKWGILTEFDICINKIKTSLTDIMSVEYSVTPEPKTVLSEEIINKWQASGFNRNALLLLFAGQDPFEYQRKLKEQQATNLKV
jgi:hypothetical protein